MITGLRKGEFMAEEAVEKSEKESPLDAFRKKLGDKENLKNAIMEGLKSTNAKVRSLAVKAAFRLKDHLIKSDKSKKVLRTVSEKITRKDLAAKVKKMVAAPKAAKKDDAAAPAEAAPAAAPKA